MIINQKKVAQVILSKLKPTGESESASLPSEEGMGSDQAGVEICQDILVAIENKSATSLWDAIKAAVQAADDDSNESGEGDDSSEAE